MEIRIRGVAKILLLICLMSAFCRCGDTVTGPDGQRTTVSATYRDEVEVSYQRDPADIMNPDVSDSLLTFVYILYDPNASANLLSGEPYHEYIDGANYRIGWCRPEKTGENHFRAILRKMAVNPSDLPKHQVWSRDFKIFAPGNQNVSVAKGLMVEGAYDTEATYKLLFRISEKLNL